MEAVEEIGSGSSSAKSSSETELKRDISTTESDEKQEQKVSESSERSGKRERREKEKRRSRDREKRRGRDKERSSRGHSSRRSHKDRDKRDKSSSDKHRSRHKRRSRDSSRSPSRSRSRRRRKRSPSLSRSVSRSPPRAASPPVNRHRRHRLASFWDYTPEMCAAKGEAVNTWQPSQENPYYSSATAAMHQATAAALTNVHNLELHKDAVNATNMIVSQQRMHGLAPQLPASAAAAAGSGMHSFPTAMASALPSAVASHSSSLVSAAASAMTRSMPTATGMGMALGSAIGGAAPGGMPTAMASASGQTDPSSKILSILQKFQKPAGASMGAAVGGDPSQANYMHATRAARRVYVGNLPHTVTEGEIRQFFNAIMVAAQGEIRAKGDSVTNVYVNPQKRFAFVEMRTPEEATQAMQLEGIQFRGECLKIGRPANYNPATPGGGGSGALPRLNTAKLGIVSNYVPNGPHKLYCGGIPYSLTEEQVKELLQSHGQLAAFFLAKDSQTGLSKGYCFFQYEDFNVTDTAIAGLNGLRIGDRQLAVRRHTPTGGTSAALNPAISRIASSLMSGLQHSGGGVASEIAAKAAAAAFGGMRVAAADLGATKVLCLSNMVSVALLKDDNEFNQLLLDVREECSGFGTVVSVFAPRPRADGSAAGCGRVFVEYTDPSASAKARNSLNGRTFDEQRVSAKYYSEVHFRNGIFDL